MIISVITRGGGRRRSRLPIRRRSALAIATDSTLVPETASWDAALAAWQDAVDAYRAHSAACHAEYRLLAETAPPEIVEPCLHQGVAPRWTTPNCLDDDPLLSAGQRAMLRPLIEAHIRRRSEYARRPGSEAQAQESDRLYDAQATAEEALMWVPAPTLPALAFKSALAYREADNAKLGFDDLGLVACALDGYFADRQRVQTHMDLLRLAGMDHPMLHMERFSPRSWIRSYEATGGLVGASRTGLLLFPPTLPPRALAAEALRAELDATPWRYRSVEQAALIRRAYGGDPVFSAHGAWDGRDATLRGPRRPYRQVVRIIFELRDGSPSSIVQRWIHDGDCLVRQSP